MLREALKRYAGLKLSLGFRFADQVRILERFVTFTEKRGDEFIRTVRVMEWLTHAPSRQRKHDWLVVVRHFALWLRAEDARHEVPPPDAAGRVVRRRPLPHIISPHDISRIVHAAGRLTPAGSFRSVMYPVLFGVMAATGLRVSEAIALTFDDITDDGLVIRQTKFRKTRLVPLHDTTREALDRYLIERKRFGISSESVFIVNTGRAPDRSTVCRVFISIVRSLGLRRGPGSPGPRLHDLRHSFAVRCLEQCKGDREAINRQVAALSTYLGHACVADTYWYLEATPLLMKQIALAGERQYTGACA